ncbi:MAG: phosphate ABC transporter ATP-binding protein [Ectothiorhodospiraceae bacterium]|nr:phosphate ABC transporter ATP-binding protein [Ectothiorhodospiraceae bacterium]
MADKEYKIESRNFSLSYGENLALLNVSLKVPVNQVTALIGPSGCGKTTFLRSINRMNDLIDGVRRTGTMLVDGIDVYDRHVDVVQLRRRVGMVFQKSNPFPKSVFDNIAYGPRVNGINKRSELEEIVEEALQQAAIWDEVKDRLNESALTLSGGQQQRICIARCLAVKPDILLMDEPASALDPVSTAKIEELIFELKDQYTFLIVTHNMQQAARLSDMTAFLYRGELIEVDRTRNIFTRPRKQQTEDYVTGRFG